MTNPLRVGNCSGFYGDRLSAMREMLDGGDLDVLTGDYLAELTMLILGRDRMRDTELGYARTFVRQLEDSLGTALERGVRIVSNAGGLNPRGCADAVREVARGLGLDVTVAVVEGDDLTERSEELGLGKVLAANAYLGAFGIAEACRSGADVVITGRVTDASVVVGPAIDRFGWGTTDYDQIAGAMAAGHIIECGTQATGGNFAFFNRADGWLDDLARPGFPIAEIHEDGSFVITKHDGTGGFVTVDTVLSQLLYEVQGARYAGPDAVLRLDSLRLEQEGPDRVLVSGAEGEAPPPQLKVSCTSLGGFRNELTFVLTGLDIDDKAAFVRRQVEDALAVRPAELDWTLSRTDHEDPDTQERAAARLTLVARDPDEKTVGRALSGAAVEMALATYPGCFLTAPPSGGTAYGVFKPGYVDQGVPRHIAVLDDGSTVRIPAPPQTQPLEPTTDDAPVFPEDFGDTVRRPLGTIAGARSGDKGGNANVGVWVHSEDEFRWLDSFLTVEKLQELLPETAPLRVERTRLPNLRAINFVVEGLLGEGVAYAARFDAQAKALGEWLRARVVDLPTRFDQEGTNR
ncbi:acyclic terpene utilization AtuA family protein [Calidifontibacter indicus]|uniref:Uncharacterized protein DUF1446 n=1 Tax=Calidifontibacter indicus TaxID=419650 RepID=A0A3D9UY00_9MICO|nr:acyclic terpene utilization AtuA family protein [Calidifontibacter indicus]REF31465.1 uncharacterized protein DUF1446 [Calidifontibacter indicus]